MAVTMRDIARVAQVDPSVISAVLNGSKSIRVSAEKRRQVLNLVKKMNYRPNLTARSLITRKSFAIGVLAYSTRDRFYAAMMAELQQQLLSRGYAGIYAFWNDDSEVEKAYDTILTRGVDGIITTHDNPALFPREIPTVIYGMQQEGYDCVLLDYETAIRNSLGYLLRLGHRKIGCLGIQPHDPRYPVFIRAMAEAGLEVRPEWMAECSGFLADAYQAAMNLLSRPDKPTALIAKTIWLRWQHSMPPQEPVSPSPRNYPSSDSTTSKKDVTVFRRLRPMAATYGNWWKNCWRPCSTGWRIRTRRHKSA